MDAEKLKISTALRDTRNRIVESLIAGDYSDPRLIVEEYIDNVIGYCEMGWGGIDTNKRLEELRTVRAGGEYQKWLQDEAEKLQDAGSRNLKSGKGIEYASIRQFGEHQILEAKALNAVVQKLSPQQLT